MLGTKIEIDASKARRRLKTLVKKVNTLPWREAGEIVHQSVKVNFVLGGSPKKWKPRKVDKPWPILRKSSDGLMFSFYVQVLRNAVAIGTRKVHAAVHNFGYKVKNIAQRKYLFAKREDINNIRKLFKKHMKV